MASQVTGACCDVGWYLHLDAGARERDAGMARKNHAFENFPIDGWQFVFPDKEDAKKLYRERCQFRTPGKMEISCIVAAPP